MRGKVLQFDYDFISAKDAADPTEYQICLTWAERQILLAMIDYIGWKTRWYSPTGAAISQDTIDAWRDAIAGELMFGNCLDCTDVWECLGVSEAPTDLLAWLIAQLGSQADVINLLVNPGNSSVPSPIADIEITAGCDQDKTFAFSLQLVQFMNTVIEDAFEIFESATNWVEFGGLVVDSIPFLSEVTDLVEYLYSTMVEQYLASYTTSLENEYACAIYCMIMAHENCTITWFDLYQYFLQRFGAGMANVQLPDLLQYIAGGGWSGSEFCDASMAMFCGVMYYGGDWAGITLAGIKMFWDSWLNDENSDWETLCTSCGWTLTQTLDSTHGETWWTATCGNIQTDRVDSADCGGYRGVIINVTLPSDRTVNRIEIDYRYDGLGEDGLGRWTVFNDSDEILQQDSWALDELSGSEWDVFIKYVDQVEVHRVKFELIASFDEEEGGYTATNEVTLSGEGSDPFS